MRTVPASRTRPGNRVFRSYPRNFLGSLFRVGGLVSVVLAALGCQELTYTGPHGERFTRRCFGTVTVVGSLAVEADTNGLRRVELRNYHNDANQALGTVTEAAVRGALQGAK
jgi:hypothetical protein